MGSSDMLDYAVFGRIAVLGHSPYTMTPEKFESTGDPVGKVAVPAYRGQPSRYGPIATLTEEVASELAGDSASLTIFWLKVWNGLAYLAIVVALHRLLRSDSRRQLRAHILWSVNPLMLWAVMAGGHNDGLAVGFGAAALFVLRRYDPRKTVLAGILLGLAIAIKAPFALYGIGLIWVVRRSPRSIIALGLGAGSVLIPCYLLAEQSRCPQL